MITLQKGGRQTIQLQKPQLTESVTPTILTQTSPYLTKQSPDANRLSLEVVGGTVAWNQLVNGAGTVTVTNNHKYVSHIGSTWSIAISNGSAISVGASDLVTDLTLMFGSTIADHVYSLEQSTAGSGIAWLQSYGFFTEDYYPYNAGELLSVKTSGHEVVGKNLLKLNENNRVAEQRITTEYTDGGLVAVASGTYSYAGYEILDLVIGQTYTISLRGKSTGAFNRFYILNADTGTGFGIGFVLTATEAYYERTFTATSKRLSIMTYITAGETTGEMTISDLQLEYGSTATPYEPYTLTTTPLSDIELRGIPKLVNNQMQYDGDSYEPSGQVTRKYGTYTFTGSESWTYFQTSGKNTFNTVISGAKAGGQGAMASKYVFYDTAVISLQLDKTFMFFPQAGSTKISVYDSAYSDASTFGSAMAGVTLLYELATETTETTETTTPFSDPIPIGSTETFIDNRSAPMPVGNVSEYKNAVYKNVIQLQKGIEP